MLIGAEASRNGAALRSGPMATAPAPVTDLAWSPDRARDLAGRVADLWAELLERLPELPVSPPDPVPAVVAPAVALPIPEAPLPVDELVEHLRTLTFEHSVHLGHPAFLAYICGAGTVPGAATELLAAGLNPCLGGYRLGPGANEIELHLTRWLAGRFGLPEGAGGLITTGGAMANFIGLKCARDDRMGIDVREQGVRALDPVAIYASEEAHVVIRRAADMLGLGAGAVRAIALDGEQRMRVDALAEAIARDRAERRAPARRGGHRRHDDDRLDRPAARDRRRRRRARRLAPRRRRVRRRRRPLGRAAAPARRDRARRLARRRPAQVDVHGAVGGLRAAARLRPPQPLVPRRGLLHLARRRRPPRRRLRHARAAVLARVRGAQGVGLPARPRPRGLRPADRARPRARPLPRRARDRAPRLRAHVPAAALDLLLPLPPARLGGERGGARPRQRAPHDRDPRGRPRALLERRDRRPLRPARVHRQLPHRGRGPRAAARTWPPSSASVRSTGGPARRPRTRRRARRPARGRAGRASSARAPRAS